MRVMAIVALALTLAACTGDRLKQSANEYRQVAVAAI